MSTLFPPLGAETGAVLEGFSALVDTVFPLPQRFRRGLPRDVAELSRLLTAGRGDRPDAYLGRPAMLSAYLRYFLPWNLYRLSRLLPALALPLSAGAALIDLGSGPLTLPLALWISRPDLRELPLDFRCLDRTGAVLDAGKELFYALAGRDSPWTIRTIRASLGTPLKGPGANLVTALNVFNEIFWPDHRMLSTLAEKNARLLSALSSEGGSILVVEPGIPRSGEFIGALRASLADRGRMPATPCPHAGVCPFPGRRPGKSSAKWCHFSFETEDAPQVLHRLSAAAGLPKERATLSFLLAGPGSTEGSDTTANRANGPPAGGEMLPVRIISDPFPVPSGYGRYGCSGLGAVLLVGTRQA
ncbi:MAG: rRNA methyltransferase, partial [Treponema sp.]|nr:rRNA methyltransferase [Treponema sp.]